MNDRTTIIFDCKTHHERMYANWSPSTYRVWWQDLPKAARQMYIEQLRIDEDKQERAREFEARKAQLVKICVPRKDIDRLMSGELNETRAMEAAREFFAGPSTILVLVGPRGVGKTFAGSWLAAATEDSVIGGRKPDARPLNHHGYRSRARFITAAQLARTSRYDDKAMGSLERIELLVIDDLGVEYADEKGSFLSLFDGLFNVRYSNRLCTVITTNLTASEFKGRYGERIVDRIRESGKFIGLDGKSMREPCAESPLS